MLNWLGGKFLRETKGHSRLCCFVKYFYRRKLLLIEGIEVGHGYISDIKFGLDVLENAEGEGILLADGGFSSLAIIKKAIQRGLKPIIKLKGGGKIKNELRIRVKEEFDTALYRLRSIAECVFGGIKTKMNRLPRCLSMDMAKKEALLQALTYNFGVYLSLFSLLSLLGFLNLSQRIFGQALPFLITA